MFWFVVIEPEGEMLSQFDAPLCTEALAVKLVELVAVTERVCGAGEEAFKVPLKLIEVGVIVSWVVKELTVRVTGTTVELLVPPPSSLPLEVVRVMEPL